MHTNHLEHAHSSSCYGCVIELCDEMGHRLPCLSPWDRSVVCMCVDKQKLMLGRGGYSSLGSTGNEADEQEGGCIQRRISVYILFLS